MLDGASHMVMMEKPAEVNKLIHDFITKHVRLVGSAKPRDTQEVTEQPTNTEEDGQPTEQPMNQSPKKIQSPKKKQSPKKTKVFSQEHHQSKAEHKNEEISQSTLSLKSAKSIPSRLISLNI